MFDVIIVASGLSLRMGFDKLSYRLGEKMVVEKTIDCFEDIEGIAKIILVSSSFIIEKDNVVNVKGGATRTDSVKCGLSLATAKYVLIHDGARPFVSKDLIYSIMKATTKFDSAIPYLPLYDSLRLKKDGNITCVNRDDFVTVQTPQGFCTDSIKKAYALASDIVYTDDSEVFATFIAPAHLVLGNVANKKITTADDIAGINAKVGCGFDVHSFCTNKKLILGGLEVPFNMGMEAHSDGDVVIHALMDALLSAVDERDIGMLFPDTDTTFKNIDSALLLSRVKAILDIKNADINNISIVIMAQKPKLSSFIPLMKQRLSNILCIGDEKISISATTSENLGITAENKGIATFAMVSIN